MGFSFSGLSLVPTAAAELDAGGVAQHGVAQHGVAAGRPASKHFLSPAQPAREKEPGASDSAAGWPAPAVGLYADGRPSAPQDAPSEAILFSSLWSSALETSGAEPSSAGQPSLPILNSAEVLSAHTASQQSPPAMLAASGEALAAAAGDLQRATLQIGFGLSGNGIGPDHPLLIPDGGLPTQSLAVGSIAVESKAAAAAVDAAKNAAAAGIVAEVDGSEMLVGPRGLKASDTEDSLERTQALPADAVSRRTELRFSGATADRARDHSAVVTGSNVPHPKDAGALKDEPAAATRQVPANDITNPLAAGMELAKSAAPSTAASSNAARPPAPPANTFPTMPQGVSAVADADASATRTSQITPQSEIAFQAEIQLNNSQDASDAAASNSQRDTPARWTAPLPREDASTNSAANHAQQPKSNAAAENAETIETAQPIVFRSSGDHAGGSSLGHDHAGGSLDRGTQQTTPLSHGPFVMNAQPSSEAVLSSRTPAPPAAAHLDAAAPDAPAETGPTARSVALKIQSEQHGAANVVLTDRGGQVHVTVRSGDPALTNALRSDLGSLAGGLQQHGFDVKFWNRPSSSTMDAEARGNSSEFSGQDDVRGQARHRHSPDDTGHRPRRGEWIEEFD